MLDARTDPDASDEEAKRRDRVGSEHVQVVDHRCSTPCDGRPALAAATTSTRSTTPDDRRSTPPNPIAHGESSKATVHATTRSDGPDHEDVNGDDRECPEWVDGNEEEVHQHVEAGDDDSDRPGEHVAAEQSDARQQHDATCDDVNPAPFRQVE